MASMPSSSSELRFVKPASFVTTASCGETRAFSSSTQSSTRLIPVAQIRWDHVRRSP